MSLSHDELSFMIRTMVVLNTIEKNIKVLIVNLSLPEFVLCTKFHLN